MISAVNTNWEKENPRLYLTLRLCLSYALAAVLWLLVLDWALEYGFGAAQMPFWLIPAKNGLFVIFSALGLWDWIQQANRKEAAIEKESREKEYEKRLAELSLTESKRMFNSLFDVSSDAIALCKLDGAFIHANAAFSELTGYDAEELSEMTFQSLTRSGWKGEESRILRDQVGKRGFSDLYEKECLCKDGSFVPVNVRLSVFYDSDGQPAGMFGLVRDVRKQRERYFSVVQAKKEAEEAREVQNRFLTVVGQELRTPLNPIIGYSDLLLSEDVSDQDRDFLNVIRSSALEMSRLVEDILYFALIDSGEAGLDETVFRLEELMATLVNEAQPLASKQSIDLTYRYDWKTCAVRGDKERIRQVLSSLLSNACKFTRKGSVSLRCGLLSGREEDTVFRFQVEDRGFGIPEGLQDEIFEPFKKAAHAPGVGIGLGLAVSKKLVTAMGGSIMARNNEDGGATFIVDLPLPVESFPETDSSAEASKNGPLSERYNILVVEDDLTSRRFAKDLLSYLGCEVSMAANGEESLRRLEEQRYDLVLMDLNMPVMDGFEATSRIRGKSSLNRDVPVVAMTALSNRQTEERCHESGMSDYVTKPMTVNSFEEVLRKWLER